MTAKHTAHSDSDAGSAPEAPPSSAPASPAKPRKRGHSFWVELPILIIVAVLVAVVVRTFLLQTFYIPSGSMETTLLPNDRVLVNKIVYTFRDPQRGEVIVFKPPSSWNVGSSKDDYIKRVIAVGGDRVICCDANGRVTVNGQALNESYVYQGNSPSDAEFDVRVPSGRLFMMGDHRAASSDSRFHLEDHQGTIPVDSVVGRAFAVFWPLGRIASLPVPKTFETLNG